VIMTPDISLVTLLALNSTFSTFDGNLTTVSEIPTKVFKPTPALMRIPFLITRSHSFGCDSTQCCLRMSPKAEAATIIPESPQTYLGGERKIDATRLPAATIPLSAFYVTLSAMICSILMYIQIYNRRYLNVEMKLAKKDNLRGFISIHEVIGDRKFHCLENLNLLKEIKGINFVSAI